MDPTSGKPQRRWTEPEKISVWLSRSSRSGQARVASAPAVDAFLASGRDESTFVDLEEIRSRRQ